MESLDTTILNTAIPAIAVALKARAGYSRQGGYPLQDCLEEVRPSNEITIFAIRHINLGGQHFVGPKPRVRFTQIRKAFE